MKDNTYFKENVDDDGISGDDVNRRLREKRLGFKAPSDDWNMAGATIHCIFKGQIPTRDLDDVVLYNFLPLTVMGFRVTGNVNVNVVNPVLECEPGPPTTEAECDAPAGIDDEHNCLNCRHGNLSICDEPCDGCFDANEWVVHPDTIEALNETLYRTGVWIALENRKHDLMSEWSLAAPDCKFQFEAEERDELLCSHDDHSLFPCHFDHCPRMRG